MYNFGKFLRKNYNEFLGPKFVDSDVYRVNMRYLRTKVSLQLVIAGMYPEFTRTKNWWDPNYNWTDFPFCEENNFIFGRKTCIEYGNIIYNLIFFIEFKNY